MKYLQFTFMLALAIGTISTWWGCQEPPSEVTTVVTTSGYDSLLAAELGADDYGMKKYVMAFLKSGPNPSKDSLTRANLQSAHLANISRLAEEGKLILAGPFLHDGELRGIYVFDVKTVEEAESLTKTDPAIQAGSLIMELIPWYGSAGLPKLSKIHEKVAKVKF